MSQAEFDPGRLLLALRDALARPEFGADEAGALLGPAAERSQERWVLRTGLPNVRSATLHFETLRGPGHVLTTVQLDFRDPWRAPLAGLERVFGVRHRRLPATGVQAPSTLAFDRPGDARRLYVVVMLQAEPPDADDPGAEFAIGTALVRRLYPDPLPASPERD